MRIIKADWITHNGGGIYSADAHPDGSRLATGGSDNAVRIWAIDPVTSKVDVKAIPIEQKGDRSSSSGGGSSGRSNGVMTVAAAAALARGDLLNPIHDAGKADNDGHEAKDAATATADDEVDDFRTTNDSSAGPLRLASLTKHSGGVNIVRWSTDGTTVSVVGFFEVSLSVHLLAKGLKRLARNLNLVRVWIQYELEELFSVLSALNPCPVTSPAQLCRLVINDLTLLSLSLFFFFLFFLLLASLLMGGPLTLLLLIFFSSSSSSS